MKPKDAIKLKDVTIIRREKYPTEEKLPENGLYRYLHTYYYQVKRMKIKEKEPLIMYGLEKLFD